MENLNCWTYTDFFMNFYDRFGFCNGIRMTYADYKKLRKINPEIPDWKVEVC